ncbi:hypothetical protein D3C87_1963730 [compost metagenome]
MMPSSRKRSQRISCEKKVWVIGPGSAMPVHSMINRSNANWPWSTPSSKSSSASASSLDLLQQMQPLLRVVMRLARSPISALSTGTSPNSFSITAIL